MMTTTKCYISNKSIIQYLLFLTLLHLSGLTNAGELSPVLRIGIQSAFGSSFIGKKTPWGARIVANTRHQRQQQQQQQQCNAFDLYNTQTENPLAESAFFRARSQEDFAQIRTTESAFVLKTEQEEEAAYFDDETELEFLESSLGQNHRHRLKRDTALVSSFTKIVTRRHTTTNNNIVEENDITAELTVPETTITAVDITTPYDQQPIAQEIQLANTNRNNTIMSTSSALAMNERGGALDGTSAGRTLVFWESMVCGAISRSVAQTIMHPANCMKTILQNKRGPNAPGIIDMLKPEQFFTLTRGAGANFLLSVPHGAINFAVLELVRKNLGLFVKSRPGLANVEEKWGAGLDFISSCLSTITCSIVSTPQMMIMDNIMVGNYANLPAAVSGLASSKGIQGFYAGWWPGLVGKIPSYALTWTLFQQLKQLRDNITNHRAATDVENSIMGCIASATAVTLMIPLDTIKTRLVTQVVTEQAYKGILDCAITVFREEGIGAFYRGLPPRLVSVVPMIGIQFGVYEFMKKTMQKRQLDFEPVKLTKVHHRFLKKKEVQPEPIVPTEPDYDTEAVLEEAMMEVAASADEPFPAPHFLKRVLEKTKNDKEFKKIKKETR